VGQPGSPASRLRLVRVEGAQRACGTSYVNDAETDRVEVETRQLQRLLAGTAHDIVVLAPYAAQVDALRRRAPSGVRVCTVDSFQGSEASCVVLSTVRTDGGGFWREAARVNVALTRARHHLCIVGHVDRWTGALQQLAAAKPDRESTPGP